MKSQELEEMINDIVKRQFTAELEKIKLEKERKIKSDRRKEERYFDELVNESTN